MIKTLSVVIPATNEETSVQKVVSDIRELLRKHELRSEIIVVDDGSTDSTACAAIAAGARVIQHRSNRGYGAALKTGIAAATYDYILIIDADETYPIARIPDLVGVLEHADMVVGARTGQNVHIPLLRRPAKWLLNRLANYVSHAHIPDINSGFRVFRKDVVMQYFPILPNQFSWTTTITLSLHCDNYAVTYIPIDYHERKGQSKIVPWDAGSFAVLILRTAMLFRPLRVFLPLVLMCLAYGVAKMSIDLMRDPNISASAILAFLSALQLLLIGTLGEAIAARLGRLSPKAVIGVQPQELENEEYEASVEIL